MNPAVPESDSADRLTAVRILLRWLQHGLYPERLVRRLTAAPSFLTELVNGVVRWKRLLEWIAASYVQRPPPHPVHACLLVGIYQMWFMDSVPDYAAVHTAVEAARRLAGRKGAALVNAVLRRIQNDRARLQDQIRNLPDPLRLSHPDVLWQRWEARWGRQRAASLCEWNNQRPLLTIRVRSGLVSCEDYAAALRRAGVRSEPHPFAPDEFLLLPEWTGVQSLPGYAEGLFTVQDPATRLAVDLLQPGRGERILDGCAAPGGKTIMIADRAGGALRLLAADHRRDRLRLLKQNLHRCRLQRTVQVRQADLTDPDALRRLGPEPFDRILLDVPCTSTGVIRRHPDVKWSWSPQRLSRTVELQHRLLDGAAGLLRPGGRLVYSTCSLEPEENQELIKRWLAGHPGYELEEQAETFPPETQTDGAFAARIVRRH